MREYNARWDFYKGMTADQIEAQTRDDTGWQRPTWPLGRLGQKFFDEEHLRDPLRDIAASRARAAERMRTVAPAELREPLGTLGLEWPVSLDVVKARYKELAKRHHPDANGGNLQAEEQFKTINLAYATVRTHLAAEPRMAAAG